MTELGDAPGQELVCARSCRDPSTAARKKREPPVGMTARKARLEGGDEVDQGAEGYAGGAFG